MRCVNCFREIDTASVCPHCFENQEEDKRKRKSVNALPAMKLLNGRYTIGKLLGAGGFGITYLAHDTVSNKCVAVKEFFPSSVCGRKPNGEVIVYKDQAKYEKSVTHFYEEAKILFTLDKCPSVAKVEGFFTEYNTAYIVMEYVQGPSLKEFIKEFGDKLPYIQAKHIIIQIALALSEVHTLGIVHSDISPSNILVEKSGDVKLIDFGASRGFINNNIESAQTVQLKPGYAPPEQYEGNRRDIGPWTDIYALACTFYRIVTGKMPPSVMDRRSGAQLQRLGEVVPETEAYVEESICKALELDYKKRYQTVDEFIADFTGYVAGEDTDIKEVPAGNKQSENRRIFEKFRYLLKKNVGRKAQREAASDCKPEGPPYLEILKGKEPGRKLYIEDGRQYLVGRQKDLCDFIVSEQNTISRVHFTISYDKPNKRVRINDRSSNGITLGDGRELKREGCYLNNDSILVLATGEVVLALVFGTD